MTSAKYIILSGCATWAWANEGFGEDMFGDFNDCLSMPLATGHSAFQGLYNLVANEPKIAKGGASVRPKESIEICQVLFPVIYLHLCVSSKAEV